MTNKKSGLEVPEASEPVKKRKRLRTYSLKELSEITSEEYELTGEWKKAFDTLDVRSILIFRGAPKSGKSTLLMKFANYLSENFGKSLYVFAEENNKKSKDIKKRIAATQANLECIKFRALFTRDKEDIDHFLDRGGYKFVFIDSIQECNMSYVDFLELFEKYKRKKLMWILVSQIGCDISKYKHKATAIVEITPYGRMSINSRSLMNSSNGEEQTLFS